VIQLTHRQETILGLIVREYVKTPAPVSSRLLVEEYGLDASSATIRNEMATLEAQGLIEAPHTSAGRVPTEEGYRYFVKKLIGDSELTSNEQHMIRHQFHQVSADVEQWLQLATSVMAKTSRIAALVTSPIAGSIHFKHMELISTQGRLVLMVMVLESGDVRQQILTLAEVVPQTTLSEIAGRINNRCVDQRAAQIRLWAQHEPTLDQEIMQLAADLIDQVDQRHRIVYTDGLMNILDPGYIADRMEISNPADRVDLIKALDEADSSGARQTLRLLEEHSLLEAILNETLEGDFQGVQVVIAGEGRWEELKHTSMVLARYGINGQITGALGVLGPMRLHYGRAVSTVRYVADIVSDLMLDLYGDNEQPDITFTAGSS
jgi:heat-inducible transcriptional repressor